MAANATQSDTQGYTLPLKVLVDKEKNKVVFAEAGKDFVDVLLSFLTLPMGTIVRLVAKDSNVQPVKVGSLSSLYESVSHFQEKHLWTPACKEMLLQPRKSMEAYCQQLKLNIDDTEPMKYFICEDWGCVRKRSGSLLSNFKNKKCHCGKPMDREISLEEGTSENGFVMGTASFIICDDLRVMPNAVCTSVDLLHELGVKNMETIEEITVEIGNKEVLDLLKCSFLSKNPLTDFILNKKQFLHFYTKDQSKFEIGEVSSHAIRQMVLKVLIRKSDRKILFVESEEDFVDFVFSFLTFPLGGVLHMFGGFSSLRCLDKLYKSVTELSPDRYLRSPELKDKLVNPPCAPQFSINNQILPIGGARLPVFYCFSYIKDNMLNGVLVTSGKPLKYFRDHNAPMDIVDPKSANVNSNSGGFVKGPAMYMVTDDLVVAPLSSTSVVSYLNRSKVCLSDLEQRVINIGLKEALSIMKASLISTSALTNGLEQFIMPVKVCDGGGEGIALLASLITASTFH